MAIDGEWEGFYFEVYDFLGASVALTGPFILALIIFYLSYAYNFSQYSARNSARRKINLVIK